MTISRYRAILAISTIVVTLVGCASEPIPAGPDTYMLSDTGAWSWSSGSGLKGDLLIQANKYCLAQGKQMMPVSTQSNDGSFSTFGHAEIQFRCLAANDPALQPPELMPTQRIEITN